jgi:hypothetical protein
MTEEEWLNCADEQVMRGFLDKRFSKRKARLFAAACCRRAWEALPDDLHRAAVEAAERLADGLISDKQRNTIRRTLPPCDTASQAVRLPELTVAACDLLHRLYTEVVTAPGRVASNLAASHRWAYGEDPAYNAERAVQAALLRDMIGNPFRPVALDPAWLTPTVRRLAQAAYDERLLPGGQLDPARLAVLADSLEDAGCSDPPVLEHCRGKGPHVRGCWCVDLLTGRE